MSPSSAIFLTVSAGKSWVSSIFAAIGRTSLSAKSRTISRTARCCSSRSKVGPSAMASVCGFIGVRTDLGGSVVVEPPSTLSSEIASMDHLSEQRTRAVLGIPESLVQHLHDAEAGIETNQIRERQRTEWVVHP